MFYIKTNISDDVELKVNLYDDEIYTQCTECGKEIHIEKEELIDILKNGDLAGTSIKCNYCTKFNYDATQ